MDYPAVRVYADGRPGQVGIFTWLHMILTEGLPDAEHSNWQTGVQDLNALAEAADELLVRSRAGEGDTVVIRLSGCLAYTGVIAGHATSMVAGSDRASVTEALERVRALVPQRATEEDGQRVPLTTWHYQRDGGAIERTRVIDVPSWTQIAQNYTASTQDSLGQLMGGVEPGKGGQLILWHGPPGTGKTFAIRALAWEWRTWADFHYVTDPEVLFGREPGYLFEVVLDAPEARNRRQKDGDRWTVLVLEDMGEILAPDARMQMGQGMARVLNLVDGLLGQGLRLLVLVTTNEHLERMHPAVARPGRCAAQIEFRELHPAEVEAWFVSRGEPVPHEFGRSSATIASLHASLEGRTPERPHVVGFTG